MLGGISCEDVRERGAAAVRRMRSLTVPAAEAPVNQRIRKEKRGTDIGELVDACGFPVCDRPRMRLPKETPPPYDERRPAGAASSASHYDQPMRPCRAD